VGRAPQWLPAIRLRQAGEREMWRVSRRNGLKSAVFGGSAPKRVEMGENDLLGSPAG